MNQNRIVLKACIFDLDGVIVDTAKYHFIAWRQLAESLGSTFTKDDNEQLKGVSRIDSLNLILEWGGIEKTEEEKGDLCVEKNENYLRLIKNLNSDDILPGVEELLKELKSLNIQIALGSASKNAVVILETLGLLEYFDTIIDGTKVIQGKPHPETFLKASKALEVDPQHCIVFEDAAKGIQAANAGGMYTVGVGDSDVLAEADYVLPNLDGISIEDIIGSLPELKIAIKQA